MKRLLAFKLYINGYVSVDAEKISAVQNEGRAGSAGGGGPLVSIIVEGQRIHVAAPYDETVRAVFGDERKMGAQAAEQQLSKSPGWFPPSSDRDHLERMLNVLAKAMGLNGIEGIIANYLDGKSVYKHIKEHFDNMTRACGLSPPVPS